MEITRQADYAVRAVLDLALAPEGQRISSDEIAGRQGVPHAFLVKVLSRLAGVGIVDSQRGVKGGVRLARPAPQITLLEVVEAIDGTITLNRCARQPGECPADGSCVVHPVWLGIRTELRTRMSAVNFGMLAQAARARGK